MQLPATADKTRVQKRAELEKLAAEVAKLLPGGPWLFTPDTNGWEHSAQLNDGAGHVFYLNNNHAGAGRLHVSGKYPRNADQSSADNVRHDEPRPYISVSAEKTPAQIAADIARRFLPDFLDLWNLCEQRRQENAEYWRKVAANMDALKAAAPMAEVRGHNGDRINSLHRRYSRVYWDAQVSDDSVSLELRSLPIDLATQIVRLMEADKK